MKIIGIAVAALAAIAVFAAAAQDNLFGGTNANLNTNRTVNHLEAADGIAYQCVRDFTECQRTIPTSSLYSQAAYNIEHLNCCISLTFCANYASNVRNRLHGPLDDHITWACPVDDGSSGEDRRLKILGGVQAQEL